MYHPTCYHGYSHSHVTFVVKSYPTQSFQEIFYCVHLVTPQNFAINTVSLMLAYILMIFILINYLEGSLPCMSV